MSKFVWSIVPFALIALAVTQLGWSGPTARADRSRTAISNSLGDIYVVGVNGGALRKLTADGRVDGYPTVSPDGRQVAFASISRAHVNDAGLRSILSVVSIDGSHFRTFARTLYQPDGLAWAPDGRRLAFRSDWRGGHYVLELASGRVHALHLGGEEVGLAWSRQGQLAYADVAPARRAGGTPFTEVADQHGKRLWRARGSFAGWSPDGMKLALVRYESRTVLIFDRAGRRLMSFRGGTPGQNLLSWAPDSEAIAFIHGRPSAVWVASLRERRVLRVATASEWMPSWSPDSRLLAYPALSGGQPAIAVSAVDHPSPRPVPGSVNMTPLGWADDRRLLVTRGGYGTERQRFEIVPVAGGPATLLAASPVGSQVTAQLTPDRRAVVVFRAYR